MINKNKVFQLIFLLFIYTVSKEFFYLINAEVYLLFKILFWTSILLVTGVAHTLYQDLKETVERNFPEGRSKSRLKHRIILLLFWALAVTSVKNVGFIATTVAPSIVIFIAFLPLIWLIKPPFSLLTKVSLILLAFAGLISSGYRPTAEVFAQLAYLWLVCSTIMKLKQTI